MRGPSSHADILDEELHLATPDLLLTTEEERKAGALSAFAQGLVSEDNAEADRALEGFRKALDLDPGYTELAIKVAFELAKRNDVAAGIQVLKDSIKARPKEPMPLVFLSQLYAKQLKKTDLGLKYAEQALALAPSNIACYAGVFEVHMAANQPAKALKALDQAALQDTRDVEFWLELGDLYSKVYLKEPNSPGTPELRKMNGIYRKAATLGKSDPATLTKTADYFVLSKQSKEAIPFYRAALALKPSDPDAPPGNLKEKLARALLETDQRAEAIELLEAILKEKPANFELSEVLGNLYETGGQLDRALAHYERSLQLDASEPRSYIRLSKLLLKAKRFERAADTMRTARARFKDRPDVTLNLAITLSQAKLHTEAMTVFAEAQAEAQASHQDLLDAGFFFLYGAAAEQAGLLERATTLLQHSIALEPDNSPEASNYLAYMWIDRGQNLDQAAELLKKAMAHDSENGSYLDSLGWLYFKRGEYEAALKELLHAVARLETEDAVVFEHLADTYNALGKKDEARQYWNKSLKLDPSSKTVAEKLAPKGHR